jgi:hypothetical protein
LEDFTKFITFGELLIRSEAGGTVAGVGDGAYMGVAVAAMQADINNVHQFSF